MKMPEEIWAGRAPDGTAIWFKSPDLANLMPCDKFIRADLAAQSPAPVPEREAQEALSEVQAILNDIFMVVAWAEIGLRSDIPVIGREKPDLAAINRRLRAAALKSVTMKSTHEAAAWKNMEDV